MNNNMYSKTVEITSTISGTNLMKHNAIQKTVICKNKNSTSSCFNIKRDYSLFNSAAYLVLIFACSALLSSCKLFSKKKVEAPRTALFYPEPPDTARFQYLTKITHTGDLGRKTNRFRKLIIGEERGKIMSKPYGIAIHKGIIYVCDMYGGPIDIIDLEKRNMYFFNPRGRGRLQTPINCFVDEKGYLYVADAGKMQVLVYDANRRFVKYLSAKEKFKPTDVNVYDGKIFVANQAEEKINVFSNDSIPKFLYSFPNVEVGNPAFLGLPLNITISNNKVYVADFGYSKIKTFKTDGTFLDTLGNGRGDGFGHFAKLKGIAVDRDSNIYAVDALLETVQIFNSKGQLLTILGGHYEGPGGLIIPAKVIIDYDNLKYFQKYVDPGYDLKFLVFVTSQYGPDLINVYGRIEPKAKTGK